MIWSVRSGIWHHPGTWSSNSVPQPTDSVIIDHYVIFADSITIDASGYLLIDSCGTLCGNNCLKGHFTNYGHMYIGCFNITGPSYNYDTIISNNTSGSGVYGGGFLISYNYVQVGPNMPPCSIPPNQRSSIYCARVMASVDEASPDLALNVYPNPASDEINIICQAADVDGFYIELFDLTGKCLRSLKGNSSCTVIMKVEDISPGYYLIRITAGNGSGFSKGVVIAR